MGGIAGILLQRVPRIQLGRVVSVVGFGAVADLEVDPLVLILNTFSYILCACGGW